MGAGYHGGFGQTFGENEYQKDLEKRIKTPVDLIDKNTLSEMQNNNVKFSKDNLVFATKDKSGQILFLEQGNDIAGLRHIEQRHAADFVDKHKIQSAQIPQHIYFVFTYGDLEYFRITVKNHKEGFERLYKYKNECYLLSGVGTNGFVVSAYPIDNETAEKHIRRYKKWRKK